MESTGPLSKGPKTPFSLVLFQVPRLKISGFLNASHCSAVHTVVEQCGQVRLFNRPEFAIVFFFFSRKRDPENLPGSRQRLNEAIAMRGVNQGNADNVGTVWCFQNSNLWCELSTMVGKILTESIHPHK